jgi:hypothetical protein
MNIIPLIPALLVFATTANAQQPQVENAKTETSVFSASSLETELSRFGSGPFWAAWSEPMISGRHGDMCWSNGRDLDGHAADAPLRLEGQTSLLVMIRIENASLDQIRVASPDCRIDAGGLPFHWLTGVPVAESIRWLREQIVSSNADSAILAIALHAGPAATRLLNDLTSPSQPARVRERTAFWLGTLRGADGLATLKKMLASDPVNAVREQVVFAIGQSKEPSALETLIDTARSDKAPQVRSRALFWLAQKAGAKQAEAINSAVANDPERSVKEQAVFALKQLPPSQGIPLLIGVAKNHPDPAVRKRAMFWLGQSNDPRALDFLTGVLK